MDKINSRLYVYTRTAEEYYPSGLANSIHFSYTLEGNEKQCLNRNYGILFAKAIILDDNTLLPLGVKDPKIFTMEDGYIGITAIRILENGEVYKPEENKVLFWKTKDLIEFTDEELMIAFHGETDINSHLRCDGIRRVHFRKDSTPYFKMAQDEDLIDNVVIIRITL